MLAGFALDSIMLLVGILAAVWIAVGFLFGIVVGMSTRTPRRPE